MDDLTHLIALARKLGGDDVCAAGHNWQSNGGRSCPKGRYTCSQAVYVCARCGDTDYGEKGGPGHADCQKGCSIESYTT